MFKRRLTVTLICLLFCSFFGSQSWARPAQQTSNASAERLWAAQPAMLETAQSTPTSLLDDDEDLADPRLDCPTDQPICQTLQASLSAQQLNTYHLTLEHSVQISADLPYTLTNDLESTPLQSLQIVSTMPLSITLEAPSGSQISQDDASNSATITYTLQEIAWSSSLTIYAYTYEISAPEEGIWQYEVIGSNDGSVTFRSSVVSDIAFQVNSDSALSQFVAGETMTFYASLRNKGTPIKGAQFSLVIRQSATIISNVSFYDDGSHGDPVANDGIATGQSIAPNIRGTISFEAKASYGAVQRQTSDLITIGSRSAYIASIDADIGLDTNDNGLYDYLLITSTIVVSQEGRFQLSMTIKSEAGDHTSFGGYRTELNQAPLQVGEHKIGIRFYGEDLRDYGKDSRYKVTSVSLQDITASSFQLDSKRDVYTTQAYRAMDFEGPQIWYKGGSEELFDTDGDGLYDQLDLVLYFDLLRPGIYYASAQLQASDGTGLGWSAAESYIQNGTPLRISYDLRRVMYEERNGPYSLRNFAIGYIARNGDNYRASLFADKLYTTKDYQYSQFDAGPRCLAAQEQLNEPTEQPSSTHRLFLPFVSQSIGSQATSISPAEGPLYPYNSLAFEPNRGQVDEAGVAYLMRNEGETLFFKPNEVVFSFAGPNNLYDGSLQLQFIGSQGAQAIKADNKLIGLVNYYKGNNPSAWISDLPTYGDLSYQQLYPGIDLYYSGYNGLLKSTYIITPNADPQQIHWRYAGAVGMAIDDSNGDLVVTLPKHSGQDDLRLLVESAPIAWQLNDEQEQEPVEVAFDLHDDGSVTFQLGSYDRSRVLYIDPDIYYSGLFGNTTFDSGNAIAIDSACHIYVGGSAILTPFPKASTLLGSRISDRDLVLYHFDTSYQLLETSYIGGSGDDDLHDLVLSHGQIALVGDSSSRDFPTPKGFDSSYAGDGDAFMALVEPVESTLRYGSYLGGSGQQSGQSIALDENGLLYIAGYTTGEIPFKNGFQAAHGGGDFDAFLVVVDSRSQGQAALRYSSYLGGSANERSFDLALGPNKLVALVGNTNSVNFPTHNALQNQLAGSNDAFLTLIDPQASGSASLRSSGYLGGALNDGAVAVALNAQGSAYLTGNTSSRDFPLKDALQAEHASGLDLFITKIDFSSTGSQQLAFSTYLGASGHDQVADMLIDGGSNIYLTGGTSSEDYLTINPAHLRERYYGGSSDLFVTYLSANGQAVRYSSLIGGGGHDEGRALTIDSGGYIYLTGMSDSQDFPMIRSRQRNISGQSGFLIHTSVTPWYSDEVFRQPKPSAQITTAR